MEGSATYNKSMRLWFVDIEAALNAGHSVEFAREMQSATAPTGDIASKESKAVAFVIRALAFVERLAPSVFPPAIALERRRYDGEVFNPTVRFAWRQELVLSGAL